VLTSADEVTGLKKPFFPNGKRRAGIPQRVWRKVALGKNQKHDKKKNAGEKEELSRHQPKKTTKEKKNID